MLNRDHTLKAFIDQWIHLRVSDGTYQAIFDTQMQRIVTDNA